MLYYLLLYMFRETVVEWAARWTFRCCGLVVYHTAKGAYRGVSWVLFSRRKNNRNLIAAAPFWPQEVKYEESCLLDKTPYDVIVTDSTAFSDVKQLLLLLEDK